MFGAAVVSLSSLNGDKWRATLFDVAVRFLGVAFSTEVEEVPFLSTALIKSKPNPTPDPNPSPFIRTLLLTNP